MKKLTNVEKIRRIPWLWLFNALNIVFCMAMFGTVFTLFLDKLGLNKSQIGLVNSFMPFAGLLALFVAPWTRRFGVKRATLVFWTARKVVTAGLLLTPWLLARGGETLAFAWVAGIVVVFAICRAIAETAWLPWAQEIIPDNVRGKVGATTTVICGLTTMATLALASYVISRGEGLTPFMWLIALAVLGGLLSSVALLPVPGGAPEPADRGQPSNFRALRESLADQTFRRYMMGMALAWLGTSALFPFVPLYMKESVGLPEARIIWLDIVGTFGGLLLSLLWGWAADRFGSKPVMLSGLGLAMLLPVCWFLIPPYDSGGLVVALLVSFLAGSALIGWGLGAGRYLFVEAVPPERKSPYMAIYYATAGVVGGVGPLAAGRLLDMWAEWSGQWWIFSYDKYSPLFLIALGLMGAGMAVLVGLGAGSGIPTRSFVGMFFQGNALTAFDAMLRYRVAKNEKARLSFTRRLGLSRNLLGAHELVEALEDPSFNVRYEAIIAISQSRPSAQLVDALTLVLDGHQPELSTTAAWALGKLGDRGAILPLRETLLSDYPLLRARSARALGMLGDQHSRGYLLHHMREDEDDAVRVACAAALGMLGAETALPEILAYLESAEDDMVRNELALAAVRILGDEAGYIRHWRQLRHDFATAAGRAVLALRRMPLARQKRRSPFRQQIEACSAAFAEERADEAARLLAELLKILPTPPLPPKLEEVMEACRARLFEHSAERSEYVALALHAAQLALRWRPSYKRKPGRSVTG